jgi:hypothetical protein
VCGSGPKIAAMSFHRFTSQPFLRLNVAFTGLPFQVPVTVAVCGPPKIWVHIWPLGVGANGSPPLTAAALTSAAQASAACGTVPPGGLQPRVYVTGLADGDIRTTMDSFVPGATGRPVRVPDGDGCGVPGAEDADPGAVLDAGAEAGGLDPDAEEPLLSLQPARASAAAMPGTTTAVLPSLDRDCLMTIRLRPLTRGSVGL